MKIDRSKIEEVIAANEEKKDIEEFEKEQKKEEEKTKNSNNLQLSKSEKLKKELDKRVNLDNIDSQNLEALEVAGFKVAGMAVEDLKKLTNMLIIGLKKDTEKEEIEPIPEEEKTEENTISLTENEEVPTPTDVIDNLTAEERVELEKEYEKIIKEQEENPYPDTK